MADHEPGDADAILAFLGSSAFLRDDAPPPALPACLQTGGTLTPEMVRGALDDLWFGVADPPPPEWEMYLATIGIDPRTLKPVCAAQEG
jgi:hypothetical protein